MGVGKTYSPARPGQPLRARDVNNNIVRAPMRGQTVSGGGNSKRLFPDGVAVDLPDSGSVPGYSTYQKLAQIESLHDDYYTVVEYSPVSDTTVGQSFYVGKPYNQQITTFPEATEAHEVGDVILILRATSNVNISGEYPQWIEAGSGGGGIGIKSAANKTALTALMSEGDIGYTTGTPKRFYVRIDSSTLCISHLET